MKKEKKLEMKRKKEKIRQQRLYVFVSNDKEMKKRCEERERRKARVKTMTGKEKGYKVGKQVLLFFSLFSLSLSFLSKL